MKSLATLHLAVLHDAGLQCAVNVSRDELTLITRQEHEGDSFLTITLPSFAKALEKGLDSGRWPRQDVLSFKHIRGLPAFLRGFLTGVFSDNGNILDEPDPDKIWAVRQICNLTAKVERDCTPERVQAAYDTYIRTDRELGEHFRRGIPGDLWSKFDNFVHHLFGDLFDKLETRVANFDLIPRHGPGAVADRLDHVQRWDFTYWPDRLETVFPAWRYTCNVARGYFRDTVPIGQELPSRVVTVPKTQKTPRIIAIEPSSIQYAQQALKRELYAEIKNSPLGSILGFSDQERNQILARQGSISGQLATLDLSEASDRVHLAMVIRLFSKWPHLRDFVLATRSRTALVQDREIHLNKFASMGSALTFPIEAIIFTTIAWMGVSGSSPLPVQHLTGRVSVYGDDIIVPTDKTADVIHLLDAFGFKVNTHKSFWSGRFRESCGKEYYAGHDVSIVRLRSEVPTSRRDAALINRFTDFRNRAFWAGLWRTVKLCDEILLNLIAIPHRHLTLRESEPTSVLALDTTLRTRYRAKYNLALQRYEERFPFAKPASSTYTVDGEGGLVKWFFENHDRSLQYQTDRYESQERAHTFRIKWVSVIYSG